MKRGLLTACIAAMALTGTALAKTKPAKTTGLMPAPARALSKLAYFAGKWTCDGKHYKTHIGPARTHKAKIVIQLHLGGHWYKVNYSQNKSKTNPWAIQSECTWGVESKERKLIFWCTDNIGSYSEMKSTGWVDDKLLLDGGMVMMGKSMLVRRVIQKKGKKKFWTQFLMMGKDEKYHPMGETTCKR